MFDPYEPSSLTPTRAPEIRDADVPYPIALRWVLLLVAWTGLTFYAGMLTQERVDVTDTQGILEARATAYPWCRSCYALPKPEAFPLALGPNGPGPDCRPGDFWILTRGIQALLCRDGELTRHQGALPGDTTPPDPPLNFRVVPPEDPGPEL